MGLVTVGSLCLAMLLDTLPMIVYTLSGEKTRFVRLMAISYFTRYPVLILYTIGIFLSVYALTSEFIE